MKTLLREFGKIAMFTILWALPFALASHFENTSYLWFFALSGIFTIAVFNHYEDLEKIDMWLTEVEEETNE